MEKQFRHNNRDFVARQIANDGRVQINISSDGTGPLFSWELDTDTLRDMRTERITAEINIEHLIDIAIGDFTRLIDEEFPNG